jgi:hypothetical protein
VAWPSERRERSYCDYRGVKASVCFFEPPDEPSDRVPSAALTVAQRDQGSQLERLAQVELADIARLDLRDHEVAALDHSAEGCSCVSLPRCSSGPGAGQGRAYRSPCRTPVLLRVRGDICISGAAGVRAAATLRLSALDLLPLNRLILSAASKSWLRRRSNGVSHRRAALPARHHGWNRGTGGIGVRGTRSSGALVMAGAITTKPKRDRGEREGCSMNRTQIGGPGSSRECWPPDSLALLPGWRRIGELASS